MPAIETGSDANTLVKVLGCKSQPVTLLIMRLNTLWLQNKEKCLKVGAAVPSPLTKNFSSRIKAAPHLRQERRLSSFALPVGLIFSCRLVLEILINTLVFCSCFLIFKFGINPIDITWGASLFSGWFTTVWGWARSSKVSQGLPLSTLKCSFLFLQEELKRLQHTLEQVNDGKDLLQR